MIPKTITENAACKGHDTDREFYSYEGLLKNTKGHRVPTLHPDHICFRCPVMQECRDWALWNEPDGVWGGLSEQELRRERKRLGIPQPSPSIGVIVIKGVPQ